MIHHAPNRTLTILAEGQTESAAKNKLKEFLDDRAGDHPKVRLSVSRFDGGLTEREVRGRTTLLLNDQSV